MTTDELNTYEVVVQIRAACPDDAEELLQAVETHIELMQRPKLIR